MKILSETLLKNFLFLVYTIKENTHTCSSKHLILFCNAIFSEWRKSISINSDLFDIIGLLDEHYVKSGFMGVSNTVNLGAATDSDNNSGVVAGYISDEADEIAHGTSSSASVPTESDTEQYKQKSTGSGTAMFSGPINTGSGLTSLRLG